MLYVYHMYSMKSLRARAAPGSPTRSDGGTRDIWAAGLTSAQHKPGAGSWKLDQLIQDYISKII